MEIEALACAALGRLSSGGTIRDPGAIWELLTVFNSLSSELQIGHLDQLLLITRKLLHNPAVLLGACSTAQTGHKKKHVLNSLIDLALQDNSIFEKLFELVSFLVASVGAKRSNTYHLFSVMANEELDEAALGKALNLLKLLVTSNKYPAPYSYFYFSGEGSGVLLDRGSEYPFVKAFACCFWFRLEDVCVPSPSRLFAFHSEGAGGVECYFLEHKLYYRVLGSQYTPCAECSNGILIYEFPVEEWTFLALEHERPRFGKNQLRVVVNGEETLSTSMEFPKLKNSELPLTYGGLCLDFTGQLAAAMFFSELITTQKMKTIFSYYHCAPQGHESFKNLNRVIDKTLLGKMVAFYHPLRAASGAVYNAVGGAEGRLLGVSGVKCLSRNRMCFLGGICAFLPIISLIKQVGTEQGHLLEE